MLVKSELKYLRIAPRKTRLVIALIKGKKVEEAQTILKFTIKRGVNPILKLLNTAIADAKNNFQLDPSNLYISKINIDGGPMYKRWRARSRGMAAPIQKRTSHITIVLGELKPGKKIEKAPAVAESSGVAKEGKKVVEKPKFERPKPSSAKATAGKEVRGLKKFFRRKSI